MTVRNGLTVEKRKAETGRSKSWMVVRTTVSGSPPAFSDWYEMIQLLVECEVEKYGGNPADVADWGRWARLPRMFIVRCFDYGVTYEDLRTEFGLPK